MKDKPTRPLSVWVAQSILLLSAVFITVLCAISFATENRGQAQFLYSALLVILPVIAVTGLITRAAWSRRAATLALLSMWAFQLRTLWVWGTWDDDFLQLFLRGSYFTAFILMLVVFAIGVPLLLLKLYRGEAESNFFTMPHGKALAAGNTLNIGNAVPDFDESLFSQDTDLLFARKVS